MFQHLAKLLTQISPRSPPYFNSPFLRHWSDGRCYSRIAPHQNYPPRTVPLWIPQRLDRTRDKKGISLTSPCHPKAALQPLPSMLRMYHVRPIRSCSKAPRVFSSTYRYPASSPEVHFHRASPRDSFPVITPFVHVGISFLHHRSCDSVIVFPLFPEALTISSSEALSLRARYHLAYSVASRSDSSETQDVLFLLSL